jgi:hypothetical protein
MLAAAWLTAAATGLLALFAVVTAWYARKAFREQSTEVGILQRQADAQQDELVRQADERRREQAARIYVTANLLPGNKASAGTEAVAGRGARTPVLAAAVHNTSGQPVYDVRVHWVDLDSGTQAGAEDELGTIGPGEQRRIDRTVPGTVAPADFTLVAYFRDAAAFRWTLTPAGHLGTIDPDLPPGAPEIAIRAVFESPFLATEGMPGPV